MNSLSISLKAFKTLKRLNVDDPPALCPLCQYPCPIVLVTLISYLYIARLTHENIRKSHFSRWPPRPLTFELIQNITKVNPHVKLLVRTSSSLAVRALTDRQTHRHTDTSDRFYTLDRRCGRE